MYHITNSLQNLDIAQEYHGQGEVRTTNGLCLIISLTGSSSFQIPTSTFKLRNHLCVPSVTKNLLSVQRFTRDNSIFFEFHPD